MSRCEHSTQTELARYSGISIGICDWGCNSLLVSIDQPDGTRLTVTAAEVVELQERVKELEAALRPFAIAYDNAQWSGNHSDQLATNQLHFRRAYKAYDKLAVERPEVE